MSLGNNVGLHQGGILQIYVIEIGCRSTSLGYTVGLHYGVYCGSMSGGYTVGLSQGDIL